MEERFQSNLQRVRNVIQMYEIIAGASQGRPSVQESDLLRAAVVFLHATLEDLLRNLAELRLAAAKPEVLKQLPWPRTGSSLKTMLKRLMEGVHRMRGIEESVTYQAIVEKGEVAALREVVLKLGSKRFGAPSAATEKKIRSITDLDRLKGISEKLVDVSSWQTLLKAK